MFLAIGLAARRSHALFLLATLQRTSSTLYDVSSVNKVPLCTHVHTCAQAVSARSLSAHTHMDTCSNCYLSCLSPVSSGDAGVAAALLSGIEPLV